MGREIKSDQDLLNTVRNQHGLIARTLEVYRDGKQLDMGGLSAMTLKLNCAAAELYSRSLGNKPKPLSP